jgi:uncharacterized membrane protein YdjX (TVP38/TMEM64 family)
MRPRVVVAALLLAAFMAGWWLVPDSAAVWEAARIRLDDGRRFVANNFVLAAAAFFLAYVVVTALSLPLAVPLSLMGGALFGRWLGTLLSVTAATCGGTLAFLASRFVLRDWVRMRLGPRLHVIETGVERDGGFYLLTLRLIPAVPYTLTNLGLGLTPMRVRTFTLVSWLGMLPGGFVFANAGAAAGQVESPNDVLSPEVIGALTLLGLLPLFTRWGVRWVVGRRRQEPACHAGEISSR